jgi:transcriptional regulator
MYRPSHFNVVDPAKLLEVMRRHSFATLITHDGGAPVASHLPVLVHTAPAPHGTLCGHMARANPQWRHFAGGAEALVVFHGPHAYISPSLYAARPAVPTWNYVAVHAYGLPRLIEDEKRAAMLLSEMIEKYESGSASPWKEDLPADYKAKLLQAIVTFEIPIARIEGKFKLGQNRPPEDVARMFAALIQSPDADARQLAEFMEREGLALRQTTWSID